MAFGGRLMKKVTGKTSGQRSVESAAGAPTAAAAVSGPAHPIRLHNSNNSVLSSSSTESGDRTMRMPYPDKHGVHQQQPPQVSREYQRSGSKANAYPSQPPSSVSGSSAGSGSEHVAKSATPDVIQQGYLLVKKGLLKGFEKRYYFLTRGAPELFCCRDEVHFQEWEASGLPVRRLPGLPRPKEALLPTLVCPVLRADRAGESSAFDRAIAVISADDPKCTSVKYLAPTPDACEDWIRSFHQIQIAQRRASRDGAANASKSDTQENSTPSSHGSRTPQDHAQPMSRLVPGPAHSESNTSSQVSDASDSPSHHGFVPSHNIVSSTSSTKSGPASGAHAAASGNVLLFVPGAGSAISISDSKLQEAKREMEVLVARGAKRPLRSGLDNIQQTAWRYGPPEYVLSDLEYIKGKTRDHDATPLESYAESCCQTFLMEATHKARYDEWTSVRQEYFHIQVNDGNKIPGHDIQENDLFGLLYLNDYAVDMDLRDGEERKDPRAILSEAFPLGFPMEVLDVYTQPPQCHFSWRHWGRFTGRYRGVRGQGELIELRGFGQMHIDGGRLMHLQLFFKQRDLFEQLNKATAATRSTRQGTVSSRGDAGMAKARTASNASSLSATSQVQQQHQQQRSMRSDKLTGSDVSISANIPVPPTAPQPQSVRRTHLYQQFMPQAQGA